MTLATCTAAGLPLALAAVMFSMGLSLRPHHFAPVFTRPRAVCTGLLGQLLGVPLLALAVVQLCGLQGALAVGLLVLSFSPGGTTSNLFSQLARGDLPLSISLTAIAGVVTPFTLPLLTAWALRWQGSAAAVDFPVALTIARLFAVMLLPLALGMALAAWRPAWAARAAGPVRALAIAAFASVILAIVAQRWPQLGGWLAQAGLAVALLLLAALALGWGLARLAGLGGAQRRSIGIEVGMQNGGTALLLTQGVLQDPQMSSVPLLYGLLMLLPVLALVWVGRREDA